ncbi:phytase [Mycolicibacterium litorale]|uniref:Phytase n=1 Tax=Mycolicibacterium litorale TaxID=758802 RepID=A0A6S6P7Y9_9MYCO|nr:esterase-like activity of phytase family protein [Mycolicibacterium litorale]BCI54754.1 phytase [Mycolicibacterium litorale]
MHLSTVLTERFVRGCCAALLACASAATGCSTAYSVPAGIQYAGQRQVPAGATFDGTVIGGLSGISYDARRDVYVIVSDDRSAKNAARFYEARIGLGGNGVGSVDFVATHPWLDVDGRPFAPLDTAARPPVVPPDPEGIAVDTHRQRLYWSSEGERLTEDADHPALRDPFVRIADFGGRYLGEFALPPALRMSASDSGPRRNSTLEGLTVSPSGQSVWAAMEGPLLQDGPPPSDTEGALTRITRFDPDTMKATAQYAYPLDRVSAGPGGDNGVSAVAALDDATFLVVERGFAGTNSVRIYRAQVGDADNVLDVAAFAGRQVRPMTKSLVADLTDIAALGRLDNIEGITLGPALPDGRRALVLVSDDNFSPTQITQVLAFAM